MTDAEIYAVVLGRDQGKPIQYRAVDRSLGWPNNWGWQDWWKEGQSKCAWDFLTYNYRVKPEPRMWWINGRENGQETLHTSLADANQNDRIGIVECIPLYSD